MPYYKSPKILQLKLKPLNKNYSEEILVIQCECRQLTELKVELEIKIKEVFLLPEN